MAKKSNFKSDFWAIINRDNVFNLPKGKKFWDVPVSHFTDLIDSGERKLKDIVHAFHNLYILHFNKNPDVSKRAGDYKKKIVAAYPDKFNEKGRLVEQLEFLLTRV